jgi:4-hydroxybenzoate polyprenyltransferase
MFGYLLIVLMAAAAAITALRSDQFRLAEPVWMLLFGVALVFLARAARKHLPRRGGQPG